MTIPSISGLTGLQTQQTVTSSGNNLQNAIAELLGVQDTQDVANVAVGSQLQSVNSGLTQASNNLVQALSLTQVAGDGVDQIQNALSQLQSLAQTASSPTLNSSDLADLNQQFQQIVNQVDATATNTSFNGQSLLDGSLSGDNALTLNSLLGTSSGSNDSLSVDSLTSGSLFGGQSLDLLTANAANQAISVLANASDQVTGAQANIGAFQQAVDFASANVESALTNQQAAQATFEPDFLAASTDASQAAVQQNAAIALAAQGNNLAPSLLQLIG